MASVDETASVDKGAAEAVTSDEGVATLDESTEDRAGEDDGVTEGVTPEDEGVASAASAASAAPGVTSGVVLDEGAAEEEKAGDSKDAL